MRNTVAEATYVFIVEGPIVKVKWIIAYCSLCL
jgi:hypothetical protein